MFHYTAIRLRTELKQYIYSNVMKYSQSRNKVMKVQRMYLVLVCDMLPNPHTYTTRNVSEGYSGNMIDF